MPASIRIMHVVDEGTPSIDSMARHGARIYKSLAPMVTAPVRVGSRG